MLDSKTDSKKPLRGERHTSSPAHLGHRLASIKSEILPIQQRTPLIGSQSRDPFNLDAI
jgi:hypothetical protein